MFAVGSLLGRLGPAAAHVVRVSTRLAGRRNLALSAVKVQALILDLETTGLSTTSDEVVQIAIVSATCDRSFQRYVLPDCAINPRAAAVHGLTLERLQAEGAKPFADVLVEAEAWLAEFGPSRFVVAAHNGDRFDRHIFNRLAGPRADVFQWVDTLKFARAALPARSGPGSYTLGRLHRDRTGGDLEGAHDAHADCVALAGIWPWLVSIEGHHASFEAYLEQVVKSPPTETAAAQKRSKKAAAAPLDDGEARILDGLGSETPIQGGETPNKAAEPKAATAPNMAKARAAKVPPAPPGDVIHTPGVGPIMAGRFREKGIKTQADLQALYESSDRDGPKLKVKIIALLGVGTNPIAVSRLVKFIAAAADTTFADATAANAASAKAFAASKAKAKAAKAAAAPA